MNINLTPEQEQIVNDELKSGHFRSAEEVIAKALVALREKVRSSVARFCVLAVRWARRRRHLRE